MGKLLIQGLRKQFGSVTAVAGIDLTVEDGEILTLLGPSGCGKTTTLQCIAGLEHPDEGKIQVGETVFVDGSTSRSLPPENRNAGLVFQSYALWPHMTVGDNVALPLRLRKVGSQEIRTRVSEMLRLVELEGLEARYPHELSGGQQQRVALARALVHRPDILLLDEPLSNLDAKLRERARGWLRELQQRLGVTTVYVTHDQIEALAMSDKVAVMKDGHILQVAPPKEIYRQPATPFVADFIGSNNFLSAKVVRVEGKQMVVELANGKNLVVPVLSGAKAGSAVVVAIRPEEISLVPPGEGEARTSNTLTVEVVERQYLGSYHQYRLVDNGVELVIHNRYDIPGTTATVHLDAKDCVVFPERAR